MNHLITILVIYLVVINIATFICYGADKRRAKRKQWRIPESTLILLAAVGGALGAWLGMQKFRHKTQHWKFWTLIPLFLTLWIILLGYLLL